jgi:hypothetical protein
VAVAAARRRPNAWLDERGRRAALRRWLLASLLRRNAWLHGKRRTVVTALHATSENVATLAFAQRDCHERH